MRNNKKYKTLLGVTPLGGLFGALRSLTNYLKMNALGMCQIIKNLFLYDVQFMNNVSGKKTSC